MNIKVVIHKAEEGGYWAEVPALPGCVSEGDTLDETKANIREAIEGYLEVVQEDNIEIGPEDEVYEIHV
ncbi:MAG: type II toxin-antitoxin system HicB family antitoxin [Balneolaceae bacterium]|nr:MAG: type II toxin-antitoxin system HicB family antitoxin [Balneolaceae bacterium]